METLETTRRITETLQNLGYIVATNKRNTLGLPQFHTHGVGNSVPDLYFYNPLYTNEIHDPDFIPSKNNYIRNGFVELKSGEHLEDIIEGASQIIRYLDYFITNKAHVFIDGKQIQNVDCFVLATGRSPFGMIYKGDDTLFPLPVSYISEKYEMLVSPFTLMVHSLIRYFQKMKMTEIRRNRIRIPKNKMNVETGIMISKIPYDENLKITYEFYAWLGRRVKPITTQRNYSGEYVRFRGKILTIRDKSLHIETKMKKTLWIPKSVIKTNHILDNLTTGKWYNLKIAHWFYRKKNDSFGIT